MTLSILVPVRNEGANLEIFVKMLEAFVETPHEILIIHDTKDDNSIDVVKRLSDKYNSLRLIHNTRGVGIPNAFKSGVEASKYEYLMMLVADDIGFVFSVEHMVSLMDEGYDLVQGSRMLPDSKTMNGAFFHRQLAKYGNKIFNFISGSKLTDPTLGIKMFKKSKLRELTLVAKPIGWAILYELALKSQKHNWRVTEVPVITINRLFGGKSTFSYKWLKEYGEWFFWGIVNLRN